MRIGTIVLFLASLSSFSHLITGEIMKLHFSYNLEKEVFPRVRIKASFSSLHAFTLCQWVKPYFDGREMTIFSYGVPGQDKEISLSLLGTTIRWFVGGKLLLDPSCDGQKPVRWVSGAWHHICVLYTNTNSNIRTFVNGIFCSKSSEYFDHIVPGNGVMVLGQALKGLDTDFHRNESWSGDIAGVQMWDEVLTYDQIVNHGLCKGKMEGNIVVWMKTPMVASDDVVISSADVCDVLTKAQMNNM